ncbi:MAG: hypothetical protein LJE87_07615 [Deltaproteobacteria bacterium]|nr:hypothetical protein [Deltaproteobacteria bacterium]
MGARAGKLTEIIQRLKKFVTEDVRKNRILGLYLVIGVMVLGYGIYFLVVMYKDITSGPEKRAAAKPTVEQVRKARGPRKKPPAEKQAPVPAPKQEAPKQVEPTKKVAEKTKPAPDNKLDVSTWKSLTFPDGSHISFPTDWSQSEVDSENSIIHGIRLQAPDSKASFKCYTRSREVGDNYAQALKDTLKRGGYTKVKAESKQLNQRDVSQITGALADKRMAISIFENQPDRYFIVRLIASKQEFAKLQPYYTAIVDSYGDGATSATSGVSIEKLEQQLEKSIEKKRDYLVGSTVYIKMKNGALHKGVVIAEDDSSITLESFRFGGRYSFTVKRTDIVEIIR